MTMPNTEIQKNSKLWNFSATSLRIGVSAATQRMPNSVPSQEPEVEMPIARPASPWRASGKPSSVEQAEAGVPGMLSRMALRLPP